MKFFDPREAQRTGPTALRVNYGGSSRNVADHGYIGYIAGRKGTGKSIFSRYLQAAGLSGRRTLNFEYDLGDRMIIAVDTEQPEDIWKMNQAQLYESARLSVTSPHPQLRALLCNDYLDRLQMQADVFSYLKRYQHKIGLLVLDRIDHFIGDANNRDEASAFVAKIKWLAQNWGTTVIGVAHTTEAYRYEDQELYGAIGREWGKIASFGWTTSLWGDVFQMHLTKSRLGPIPPIRARYNESLGAHGHFVKEPFMPL